MIFKHAIFDLDGTILNTERGIANSIKYGMRQTGYEVDISNLSMLVGPPLHEVLKECSSLTDEQIDEFIDSFREYNNSQGYLEAEYYPGMPALFETLHTNGIRVYVATSKLYSTANTMAEHYGFAKHLDYLAGSSKDRKRSDKADVLRYLLECCDIDKNAAVMIGDRKYDLIGGRQVGIHTIGVSYGFAAPGELEEFQPLAIAHNTRELEEILLGKRTLKGY